MRDKRFPGVSKYQDRHGKWRWRVRAKGRKAAALPGEYGSPEFIEAWNAWVAEKPRQIGIERRQPGSISSLIAAYYSYPEFQHELSETTRKAYRATLERFRDKNGDKSVKALTRENITAIRDQLAPEPSNMMLRCLSHLCKSAAARGAIPTDPTVGLRRIKTRSEGTSPWTDEDVRQFEEYHPLGTRPRLALALLLYTAQRRSDVVVMGRQHETNGGRSIRFRQRKTGVWLTLPIVGPLREALNAGPTGALTYLETMKGKPFAVASFGNWFGAQCREAGLKDRTAHGLRKAAATRLAMAGATAHEIQAVTGHRTLSEVQRYTQSVNQTVLAESMADALAGTKQARESGEPLPTVGEPLTKALK